MARRSGPVSLVVASILVLAIPVVMLSVSSHRDRGATNVQIQFAAGGQQAPAATSQGKTPATKGGAAHPATSHPGGAPAGWRPRLPMPPCGGRPVLPSRVAATPR